MDIELISEKNYEKIDFTEKPVKKAEYEYCSFSQCNFSGSDFSDIRFSECTFSDCNLSLARIAHTSFRDIKFLGCKMLGQQFQDADTFGFSVYFEHCVLNHSSFYKLNLKKMIFKKSKLHEVDFTEADLTGAVFQDCDLAAAVFDHTILEKVDFRTSCNYSIDPELNKIKKAKFSLQEVAGLLHKYDIEIDN